MSDMRVSFEHQFKKYCGSASSVYLLWCEQYYCYKYPETQAAFSWYCRGYCQGERG